MKRLFTTTLIVIVMLLTGTSAKAQIKAFEKFRNTQGVTYVYISSTMLNMAGKSINTKLENHDIKLGHIIDKISAIQIISSENKSKIKEIKKNTDEIITNDSYQLLMDMSDDDDKVMIYNKTDKQNSVLIMTNEEKDDYQLIVFSGNFTMDDIQKITTQVDLD